MRRQHFHYHLPNRLIARFPTAERSASRLLYLNGVTGQWIHSQFSKLLDFLRPGDLLVFNDTKVMRARLYGRKSTGGKVEILIERVLAKDRAIAHVRAGQSPAPGTAIRLENGVSIRVVERRESFFVLDFQGQDILHILDAVGHVPLPPYIDRDDEHSDRDRYQTVFARHAGAVAAPTAGLHFDRALLERLQAAGIETAFITLHVGAGTFQPMRVDNITEHAMHSEYMTLSQAVCDAVNSARAEGRRVVAVGTTSVRALETAASQSDASARRDKISAYRGDTSIFIYPGYRFRVIDALITNFHLPESTLLMLVAAFAGYRQVMNAYRAAVAAEYRFFSYGDAMLIERNPQAEHELIAAPATSSGA